jgi:nucleoside-diphosphate-sugar epimerase
LIIISGAGGFIGGHLVAEVLRQGRGPVRAVDRKPLTQWYQVHARSENLQLDLTSPDACERAIRGGTGAEIYNLAADMGGMGFIENNKARCMLSVLINTNMLIAARDAGAARYFFSSSACVYNDEKQRDPNVTPLKESDAYPAMPEDGYGWEKLFSERMCRHFTEDFGLETRIARYHNVYGPHGTYQGGREKAPAATCRKVVEAELTGGGEIEIWGDGKQTRSFTYIDDCVKGTLLLMQSDVRDPVNIGSSELVTIDDLYTIAMGFANVRLERRYILNAPRGVNGRNSDNSLILEKLGWAPQTSLADGLKRTYDWIRSEMTASAAGTSKKAAAVA